MTEPIDANHAVYVKYESLDGALNIAAHERPALLGPNEDIDDFIRDLVHAYKTNHELRYLGLADEDEYSAFKKIQSSRD